jgi:hypothetical protein
MCRSLLTVQCPTVELRQPLSDGSFPGAVGPAVLAHEGAGAWTALKARGPLPVRLS